MALIKAFFLLFTNNSAKTEIYEATTEVFNLLLKGACLR